jgi:hypothetical protein
VSRISELRLRATIDSQYITERSFGKEEEIHGFEGASGIGINGPVFAIWITQYARSYGNGVAERVVGGPK